MFTAILDHFMLWKYGKNVISFAKNIRQAPVVRRLDKAIHRINHYPVDSVVCFVNTYPLDSDLSGRHRYPALEQPGPGVFGQVQKFLSTLGCRVLTDSLIDGRRGCLTDWLIDWLHIWNTLNAKNWYTFFHKMVLKVPLTPQFFSLV